MQDQTQTMLDDGFGNIHLPRPTPLWINTLHYFFFGSTDYAAEIDPY